MRKKILKMLADVIFPVVCVQCGAEGEWWCKRCLDKVIFSPVKRCPICHRPTADGAACAPCRGRSFLDGVTAFFPYDENSPAGRLIKFYKYNYARGIEAAWQKIIDKNFARPVGLDAGAVVIPVPLHPRRERERGFNQAAELARLLSEQTGHVYDGESLRRVRYTKQQAHLSGADRQNNIRAAFEWTGASAAPASALLVDDVFTTGATMQECARILKQAGVKTVRGWTLARG